MQDRPTRHLALFLRVYGTVSLVLFTTLLLGFVVRWAPIDEGAPLHWVIWDRVTHHVAPMLFAVYIVWAVHLLRAARDPVAYASFLDFTMWANLAHALIMVPMALVDPMYHSKFLTDIPFILLLSGALALWRPSRERATSGEAAAVARATG
ncbi:MAG: DUF6632 domain-containing protein [Gemmatimonadaceae bacterium]